MNFLWWNGGDDHWSTVRYNREKRGHWRYLSVACEHLRKRGKGTRTWGRFFPEGKKRKELSPSSRGQATVHWTETRFVKGVFCKSYTVFKMYSHKSLSFPFVDFDFFHVTFSKNCNIIPLVQCYLENTFLSSFRCITMKISLQRFFREDIMKKCEIVAKFLMPVQFLPDHRHFLRKQS